MEVNINLTGGSYEHKSLPVSAQITRNFWPQAIDDPITSNKYILESFVGQSLFGSTSKKGRGIFFHNDLLYRVAGNRFYSIDQNGVHTELGVLGGSERCIFDSMGDNLIIVTERKAYVWDGVALNQVTDPDLESPDSVTVINNQAIYDGDNGRFGVSDVGDPTSISGLNYATAESKADDLIRVYAFDQKVYMFGEATIEQWWNSGVGKPPFDRVQGAINQIGLGALHGLSSNVNYMYFLGNDRRVYRMKGAQVEAVTNYALVKEFESYSSVEDCIIWCMDMNNQNFVVVTFPTVDKTWVYVEGGQWFEWSSGGDAGRNKANSYTRAYGKHLVEDYANGNLYELDFDVYTENGDEIIRQRDSAPLNGKLFGTGRKSITMNKLVLHLETGIGIPGSDEPVVMLSFSDDGGKTFSTERWAKVGNQGQFEKIVEWNNLGQFKERVIRLRMSDPVFYAIRDCVADIEVGI